MQAATFISLRRLLCQKVRSVGELRRQFLESWSAVLPFENILCFACDSAWLCSVDCRLSYPEHLEPLTCLLLAGSQAPVRRDDPTLPPPWQALYEPTQNATYYWNPNTNITQYERPAAAAAPPPMASRDPYASNVRLHIRVVASLTSLIHRLHLTFTQCRSRFAIFVSTHFATSRFAFAGLWRGHKWLRKRLFEWICTGQHPRSRCCAWL